VGAGYTPTQNPEFGLGYTQLFVNDGTRQHSPGASRGLLFMGECKMPFGARPRTVREGSADTMFVPCTFATR